MYFFGDAAEALIVTHENSLLNWDVCVYIG